MIKGSKVQLNNTATIAAYSAGLSTGTVLLTLPTGKTFVLTDLVCGFTPIAITGTAGVIPGIALFDESAVGNTAVDMDYAKFVIRLKDTPMVNTSGSNALVHNPLAQGPLVVTGIENGPEFSQEVVAGCIGTWAVPTFGLWLGGVLR